MLSVDTMKHVVHTQNGKSWRKEQQGAWVLEQKDFCLAHRLLVDEFLGPLPEIFNTFIVVPLINMLFLVYTPLEALGVPYALGFSIIGLTILIRIIFYPLTNKQLKASKKMQDIAPLVSDIKDKYKGDTKRIQEETMKIYKEKGVNPAAGCLPTLVQLPLLFGLYSVMNKLLHLDEAEIVEYVNSVVITPFQISGVWDPTFFGIPLALSPQQMLSEGLVVIAIAIPVVTGFFQFILSKMMFAPPPEKKGKDKKKNDDFASTFQRQAAYIFPIMIGFFAFNFPFGLSLYWNTFSIFGIIQQYKVTGLGGLESTWQKVKNR